MRVHAFHRLYQHRLDRSTKPFIARGCKVVRCPYCQVAQSYCLCAHQPNIKCGVQVLLIVSDNEVFKPSNTGRLIADTVRETHVYQWQRTEPDPDMLALIADPSNAPVLVFPDAYVDDRSRLVTPEWIQSQSVNQPNKTPLLILFDGSWREARKMFRKSSYLAHLPVVSLTPESVSQYLIRRSDNEQHLATAEVASLLLAQLGEVKASRTLSDWFSVFREAYLLTKSRGLGDATRPALKHFIEQSENENSI